ncbi:MAG: hypothetical protein KKA19_06725, partial [Candidatus Margulisbacteria bacterium]|nr:hypothetical protein [Candidatus Margulisiibacteriota bacterium]
SKEYITEQEMLSLFHRIDYFFTYHLKCNFGIENAFRGVIEKLHAEGRSISETADDILQAHFRKNLNGAADKLGEEFVNLAELLILHI